MFRLSLGLFVFALSACGPDGAFSGEDEVLRFMSDLHDADHWRPSSQPLATGTGFQLRVLNVQDAEVTVDGAASSTWSGADFVQIEAVQSGDAWIDVAAWNDDGDELHDGVGFDVADAHRASLVDEAAWQFEQIRRMAVEHNVPVRLVGEIPPTEEGIRPLFRGAEVPVLPALLDDQGRSLRYDLDDVTMQGARLHDDRFWAQDLAGPTVVRHLDEVVGTVLFEPVDVDDVAYVELVALDAGVAGPELCINALVWAVPYTADGRRILGAPVHVEGSADVSVVPFAEDRPLGEVVGVHTLADTPSSELVLYVTVGAIAQRVVLPIGLLPMNDSC